MTTTVKAIWFIDAVPGLPVYEMQDGTLKMPFFKKDKSVHFWMSERELTKGIDDKKTVDEFRKPFIEAIKQIDIEKTKRKTASIENESNLVLVGKGGHA